MRLWRELCPAAALFLPVSHHVGPRPLVLGAPSDFVQKPDGTLASATAGTVLLYHTAPAPSSQDWLDVCCLVGRHCD